MPFVIALAVSLVGTAVLVRVGPRLGLVDRPGALKLHARPVALAGAAVAAGALAGAWPWLGGERRMWFVVAVVVALAAGLVDDIRPISPWIRLAAQVLAGVCLAAGGLTFAPLGPLGGVAVVIATVAACNAVNMVDGQDGLATGLGAFAAAGLAGVAAAAGMSTAVATATAGAALGFLAWNRPPARAFLGDGGAYALGVLLVVASATAATDWPGLFAAAVCLGFFLVELASTVVRRRWSSAPAVLGDREHAYDRLAEALGSRTASTLACWACGALLALGAQAVARLQPASALAAAAGAGVACTGWLLTAARPIPRPREEPR